MFVHSFLINVVLLCNSYFSYVKDLAFLLPGILQLLFLEVSISKVFGDFFFMLLIAVFVAVMMTAFWCVLCRGT
jgi:hypothetical protein